MPLRWQKLAWHTGITWPLLLREIVTEKGDGSQRIRHGRQPEGGEKSIYSASTFDNSSVTGSLWNLSLPHTHTVSSCSSSSWPALLSCSMKDEWWIPVVGNRNCAELPPASNVYPVTIDFVEKLIFPSLFLLMDEQRVAVSGSGRKCAIPWCEDSCLRTQTSRIHVESYVASEFQASLLQLSVCDIRSSLWPLGQQDSKNPPGKIFFAA